MADTLSTLSRIAYLIAGASLVLAIVLWFVFQIPQVFGDLTGRTAKKSIARIRAENEKEGKDSWKKRESEEKKKMSAPARRAGLRKNGAGKTGSAPTVRADKKRDAKTGDEKPETGLLEENLASQTENATALLTPEPGITEPLASPRRDTRKPQAAVPITMISSEMMIHTEETIP